MNKAQPFYPGLFIYAALLCASALSFAFLPMGPDAAGFLMVLWGGFALMRALWVLDILDFENRPEGPPLPLPRMILSRMKIRRDMGEARYAAATVSGPVMALFLLAALYFFSSLHVMMTPQAPQAFAAANALIAAFFTGGETSVALGGAFDLQAQATRLGRFVIIGLAFWMTQSYAREKRNASILLRVTLVLFCALFAVKMLQAGWPRFGVDPSLSWRGYGWENLEILNAMAVHAAALSCLPARFVAVGIGAVFLYALALIPFLIFARAALRGDRRTGLTGLAVLAALAYGDLFTTCDAFGPELWLAGWATIAVLWCRADRDSSN